MSTAWKTHERTTAKALGGTRQSRGANFGQSLPDIEHSIFSVECKYRKQLPRLLRLGLDQASHYDENKVPVLVVKERNQKGSLVVMRTRDFTSLFGSLPEPQD
jgi:hypothetical protein